MSFLVSWWYPSLAPSSSSSPSSIASDKLPSPSSLPPPPPPTTGEELQAAWTSLLEEGGGEWPPNPDFTDWPPVLERLHHLALEMGPRTGVVDPSTLGQRDVDANRAWLVQGLAGTDEIVDALRSLDQRRLCAVSACVAWLCHYYRWGTTPVLTCAQQETQSHLPAPLTAAMAYLNLRLGILSTGGSLTTMVYHNYDVHLDRLHYSLVEHLGDARIYSSELWMSKLFAQMERIALPLFGACIRLASDLDAGTDSEAMVEANDAIRSAFSFGHRHMREGTVNRDTWARYVGGFFAWSWDGCPGASGSQSFLIQCIDALLGIPLTAPRTHLTSHQRRFVEALRDAQLRQRANAGASPLAAKSLDETARILKTWRLGHIRRAIYYEDVDLPERKPTIGRFGVDADRGLAVMLARMTARLRDRITVTM
ncbi:uncharacterized protein PFL1_03998 [Pseudozyma flocculosa PF-1]|uniref:Indoleamine 2,3-dioxygenase n=2 Tax=Pseudozyma flocculosa TaxID=84751 RepID=A0A5C3F077_9BASI|nr:uncharacterized protein PFL1_03998 [Pseudozyma flocculosa PF-1]EPQ28695.1 hypothetical protein PFL1_03998 [Pseudozyma flocculosa PF-1]SPO36651.1 uncharacterized protein PSFLO_02122 [Pseudozyma flocculosa]